MIGRKGSVGFPRKNIYPVLGRPLCAYPLLAAKESKQVKRIFVSTDCPDITTIARDQSAELIERPPELAKERSIGGRCFCSRLLRNKKKT